MSGSGHSARDARPALAALLACRPRDVGSPWSRDVGLVPRRRRQRRIGGRLDRAACARFELGDPGEEGLDLVEELGVLRDQLEHQRLQAVLIGRINALGFHPKLESDRGTPLNASTPSQTAAQG